MTPDLGPGAQLLATARFFEAHEVWEECWREMPHGEHRRAVQGLIHLAVALEHRRRGNLRSAAGQWKKSQDKLAHGCAGAPFDVAAVLRAVAPCLDAATRAEAAPVPDLAWVGLTKPGA